MDIKDVYELFIESLRHGLSCAMSWREILRSKIDCYSDETWEELFSNYPDVVYDNCYKYYKTEYIN